MVDRYHPENIVARLDLFSRIDPEFRIEDYSPHDWDGPDCPYLFVSGGTVRPSVVSDAFWRGPIEYDGYSLELCDDIDGPHGFVVEVSFFANVLDDIAAGGRGTSILSDYLRRTLQGGLAMMDDGEATDAVWPGRRAGEVAVMSSDVSAAIYYSVQATEFVIAFSTEVGYATRPTMQERMKHERGRS